MRSSYCWRRFKSLVRDWSEIDHSYDYAQGNASHLFGQQQPKIVYLYNLYMATTMISYTIASASLQQITLYTVVTLSDAQGDTTNHSGFVVSYTEPSDYLHFRPTNGRKKRGFKIFTVRTTYPILNLALILIVAQIHTVLLLPILVCLSLANPVVRHQLRPCRKPQRLCAI